MAANPNQKTTAMVRMQLLVPPDLKAEIEAFGSANGLSANEAMRVLTRRGLSVSGSTVSAAHLAEELSFRVRDMERKLLALTSKDE